MSLRARCRSRVEEEREQGERAGKKFLPVPHWGTSGGSSPNLSQGQRRQVLSDAGRHLPEASAWGPREEFLSAARGTDAGNQGLGCRDPPAGRVLEAQGTARARG